MLFNQVISNNPICIDGDHRAIYVKISRPATVRASGTEKFKLTNILGFRFRGEGGRIGTSSILATQEKSQCRDNELEKGSEHLTYQMTKVARVSIMILQVFGSMGLKGRVVL